VAARRAEPLGIPGLAGLLARIDERGLEPAYLLVGDDRRDVDAALVELETRAVPEDLRSLNSVRLRGLEDTCDDVVMACATMPMLGERRFVLVREPERLKGDTAHLVAYLKRPSEFACLVLVPASLDRRLAWVKAMEASSVVVSFEPPAPRDLDAWVRRELKSRGLQVEPAALNLLRDLVDTETLLLANELEKLALLCADRKLVTAEDVESILGRSRAIDSFVLTNAIEDGDPGAAVAALRRLLEQGAAVPMLVGMVDWCVGRLLASEEPRTFPARKPVLLRRRAALSGRALEVYALLKEADRLVRTSGGDAEAALERSVLVAAGGSRSRSTLNPGSAAAV
jgi:DNA polymerase-3 subunit delta